MAIKYKGLRHKINYFKRSRNIFHVFAKYGFGHFLEKLNIESYLENGQKIFFRKKKNEREPKSIKIKKGPVRFRLALEELGPTFIKLGQILSTRSDLLPIEYIEELKKLQDKVAPVDYEEIKKVIESNLEKTVEELFLTIDEICVGSASIAQAHRAVLKNGQEVILKVKKPNIDELIELDIEIMYSLARLLKARVERFAMYDLVGLVTEFSKSMRKEVDFTREGKNNDVTRNYFAKETFFSVPKIYWEYTASGILTQEMIHGIKLSDLEVNSLSSKRRENLAKQGSKIMLKMILTDGFFHADPHPGNIILTPEDHLILIDYGNVGTINDEDQEYLAEIIEGIVLKDAQKIVHGFKQLAPFPSSVNEKLLKSDILDIVENYYNVSIKNIKMGKVIEEITSLLAEHRIVVPANFFSLAKSLMIAEGVCRQLYPDFDMVEAAKPYIKKLLLKRYRPEKFIKNIEKTLVHYAEFFENAPKEASEILKLIKQGKLGLDMKINGLDRFRRTLDRVANRISISLVIAALIIGSSMLIEKDAAGNLTSTAYLGLFGYIIACFFGILIVFHIFRKDKY